jgi:FkbM family methyltransferase
VFNRGDAYQQLSELLEDNGFSEIIWPWTYYPELHKQLGWCYWLDAEPRDLLSWQDDPFFREVMGLLADDESRSTIERIIAFRYGGDLAFSSYKSQEQQYFNDLTLAALPSDRPVSYLDVGAYTGDTLSYLCEKAVVGKAIMFEPDPYSYRQLIENVKLLTMKYFHLKPIVLPLGAGNEFATINLEVGGEASSLHIQSNMQGDTSHAVTVAPVDDVMPAECVDFVKIDVEGHDREAIQGMRELLTRSAPVVAVSLYHRPRDFVELTLYLMQTLQGMSYKYYVRQHLYNSFETVLYAIPSQS